MSRITEDQLGLLLRGMDFWTAHRNQAHGAVRPRFPIPPLRMYNHPVADLEVNKNVLSISHFHDPSDDEFWHAASPSERLAAVQIHREAAYGKTAASARLQRVLEITEAPTE